MRAKISKRTVDGLRSGERDDFLWDTELPGFGCKITPKGTRIYILQYGRSGRDHRITIGRHGVDITPEQARLEAQRLRGLVASGETLSAAREKRSENTSVAELGRRYLDEYAIPHKKPSGIAQDRRNLQNHVMPLIGKLQVKSIERADIARVMRDVAVGKTAKDEKTKLQGRRIVRGGEIVANRVQALLSKMFALAEDWKIRPEGTNPCRGVKRYAEHKVERFLSYDELTRLGTALSASEVEHSASKLSRTGRASIAALRLLLLTGCRVGEVLGLQWRHFDQERRLLMLPDSKTGAKSVFLNQPAIDLLLSLSRDPGTDYVFDMNFIAHWNSTGLRKLAPEQMPGDPVQVASRQIRQERYRVTLQYTRYRSDLSHDDWPALRQQRHCGARRFSAYESGPARNGRVLGPVSLIFKRPRTFRRPAS